MTSITDSSGYRPEPALLPRFGERLHDDRTAALLGIVLGVMFSICLATGVLSHLIQHPPDWFTWPSRPAGFYRVSQGLHVTTGIALIPRRAGLPWGSLQRCEWR